MTGIDIIEQSLANTKIAQTPWEVKDYAFGSKNKLRTLEEFSDKLQKMIDDGNEETPLFFVDLEMVKNKITFEYARYLETCGIIISAFTIHQKYGGYALDYLKGIETEDSVVLRFCRLPESFKIITQKPNILSKEELAKNGFNNIYVSNQIISICQKKGEDYVWGTPIIVPDGMHTAGPLTVAEQYGQSCFEGIASMAGKEDTMIVLRPKDNARRLQISASSISIPPIDETVFEKSIEYILKSNLPFMPESGDNFKIYIRPYLKGLEGGYGVGAADTFIFCVQIFPFGNFVGPKENALNLIAFEGYRRSHAGGFGSKKVSGNYAQTILVREKVKKGIEGKVYDDVFFLGMKHRTTEIDGQQVVITEDILDEDAAGNLMFFKMEDDQVLLVTPPLSRKSFLGGFTRDTILKMASCMGIKTEEREIKFDDLSGFDGAFLTGSAVGMAKIKSMEYKSKTLSFYDKSGTIELFEQLYDRFYELRMGQTSDPEIKKLIASYSLKD